jgi:hypothetical protein
MRKLGTAILAALLVSSLTAKVAGQVSEAPPATGPDQPLAGYSPGKFRGDYFRYSSEKPVFSIDAGNVDKYADKLSAGQIGIIKQRAGYRMDVYPTHRTCWTPDWIRENTKENETKAKLNGDFLETAVLPGVPFPNPKSGLELIWNWLTLYRGVGYVMPGLTLISPKPGDNNWIEAHYDYAMFFPWGAPGKNTPQSVNEFWDGQYYKYSTPPALLGQGLIERYYFDRVPEAWYYFTGQRRVRRLPVYTYDAPIIGLEGMYLSDQVNIYYSPPDRFNWKIVGKKQLYIPYNSFGMYDFRKKAHDVYLDKYINPANRRYELHEVWVLDAKVKPDARHVAPHKILYIDTDSWMLVVGEDYDVQGKLWTASEAYPIPIWELGGTCDDEPYIKYDLISGRYVEDITTIGNGKDVHYGKEPGGDPKFTSDFYTAETLKSLSER